MAVNEYVILAYCCRKSNVNNDTSHHQQALYWIEIYCTTCFDFPSNVKGASGWGITEFGASQK